MNLQLSPKKYSIGETYLAMAKGLSAFIPFLSSQKSNEVDNAFQERIMLAVTEVNGCELCSYAHAKMALEKGLSNEDIQLLLSGNPENIPTDEAKGIFFAQHYADTKGHPTEKAWNKLIDAYGEKKAGQILASIRVMMLGNVIGIPYSSFLNRLKGQAPQNSSLVYELAMIFLPVIFFPASILHALIAGLFRIPLMNFNGESNLKS